MNSRGGQVEGDEPGGESLPELLRSWRSRMNPRGIPGLVVSGRRGGGLTQRDVARLTGVSERWYGELERGNEAGYSADFLDRLSSVLGLSRAERHVLYLRAVARPPALASVPEADAAAEMDELLQQFLDSQAPNPAFATDLAWNVIGYNEPLLAWFPWAAHQANQMRWAFLMPEARDQLVNWEQDWARPYLGQIRYERSRNPKNRALQQLERDVLAASPAVRKMWDRREMVEHVDGDLRRLRLPCHGGQEVVVRILALRPMRSERLRVIVLMGGGSGVGDGWP
ncbi:helix-turn-helix domain-containing protein [Streptomyces sp. NBC_00257]|uniref:MmyB family transcriptional regulator n=1 Tax=unclassified Streptomyces TaxID=2593676 RepID=UPI0022582321|nr:MULTISPECIES: helix-turn-helix domain-containing protein [unclassified Streptomyces]MCX4398813.1 helix-turn-helix domain-containing protein [Streptomyces sp. NBC_01767]MCX4870878.1 helix-turn-helix domain-containing protein [Streptomyces sp. NBC_00906]MCX4901618.1 helix-turn-helix domain-containing protein [Streptomyces sp. NBC_00892]MCX5426861.1 helix-turn-helix domain-containing protein [Streptomyces sp. NBC_00062]WSP51106.1 helix-turn-helix domain-containing protein [Streptomyces sp. NBC